MKYLKIFLICFLAEIGNILSFEFFVEFLHFPMFFDTIFTIAVTFYLGLFPGILTALFYNIIRTAIFYFSSGVVFSDFLYSICGVLIVFSTWIFSRNKENFKQKPIITILYLLQISLVSSLVSCISGGIIDFSTRIFFEPKQNYSSVESFIQILLLNEENQLLYYIVARIPVTTIDRIIATFLGFGIYRLLKKYDRTR